MKFNGDILITDPCYLMKEATDDWSRVLDFDRDDKVSVSLELLGIENFLVKDTIYGDWSCTTFETGTLKILGEFCADAGLVCVVLLEEVLKYNPNFDYHLREDRKHCVTWLKNFHGEVNIEVIEKIRVGTTHRRKEQEVRVIGKGNINFYTKQTGL